ncbi:carbohydrate ABC transporter permease [Microlunatus parietis]|uniref:Multiple sugar transport system permease protein n=1 Tax=Microlunatus parietis TaxID=682979 RepID=A0A7Y9I5Y8_9ACTN|nr:sugar ABC transporter permease [Microlunatus parietis]NYE70641.1 multiple sugar transport system permease protein [Microlunatus parietis]
MTGHRQRWLGWVFVSPALLWFLIFVAGPFLVAIGYSFLHWDLITPARFAGVDNYAQLVADPMIGKVFGTTFAFAFASVVTHVVGGLLLALLANRQMNRIVSGFFRTAIFFPFLISWAAVSLLWRYVLDPEFGFVSYYLKQVGITPPLWFVDPAWALPGIIGIDFWHTIGYTFVIMLAGLQTVPPQLTEAARVDGATRWQVFWNVTVPMMSPTLFFATVITFIGAFQIFDPMKIITNGGPDNSTKSIVMYLYEQGFQAFQVGYASAIALVVFVVIMVVTALQFWLSRRWVYES